MKEFAIIILLFFSLIANSQIDSLFVKNSSNIGTHPPDSNDIYLDTIYSLHTDYEKWEDLNYKADFHIFKDSINYNLVSTVVILDSIIIRTYYFSNGQVLKIEKERRPNFNFHYSEAYYKNGQLFGKGLVHTDTLQNCTTYWDNGQAKEIFGLQKGYWIGEYKTYYQNGQLKEKGKYPSKPGHDYEKIGEWFYYDEKGNRLK